MVGEEWPATRGHDVHRDTAGQEVGCVRVSEVVETARADAGDSPLHGQRFGQPLRVDRPAPGHF